MQWERRARKPVSLDMKGTDDDDLWAWVAIAIFALVPSIAVWLMVLALT
jgi:hypothetical protein